MANVETIEVGSVNKNNRGDIIRVSKAAEKSGGNSIDVRMYYTDDEDNVLPTKKGVRINSELAPEVLALMFEAMDSSAKEDFIEKIHDYLNEED